jgi:hypothetical protein
MLSTGHQTMPNSHLRLARALLACAGITLPACVIPSDQSDQLVVTVEAPATLLVRGRTMVLTAHAWQRSASGALTELSGVEFDWQSVHSEVATVDPRDDGSALVTPVNEGVAEIRAFAPAFEKASPASVVIRVANALTIDSIRPTAVHYGEQVTLYGVGLGEVIRTSLGQADLIADSASFSGDPQGLSRQSYWVPYPAQSSRLVAISRRGSTTAAPETTVVHGPDLYHETQAPPPRVDLGGGPVRGPDTLFYNPALAVVPSEGTDALGFHRDQGLGSVSFSFTSTGPVVALFDPVLTEDQFVPAGFPTDGVTTVSTWALGFSGQYCQQRFVPFGRPVGVTAPVTLVRAFKDMPARDLLLAVYGNPPGAYAVTVRDGYVTADPRIGPDRFEENDYCAAADTNANHPDLAIDLPFADTLTIDNPYEVDWFAFSVPGDPQAEALVTARSAARPFGGSDSSNVGLMFVAPHDSFGVRLLDVVAQARTPGSGEVLTALLRGGPNYLVVVDDGGVATRYSMCLGMGSSCQLLDDGGVAVRASSPGR